MIMEVILTKVQKLTVLTLAGMLVVVMVLSTIHLGVLIFQQIMDASAVSDSSPGIARDFWVLPAGPDRRRVD